MEIWTYEIDKLNENLFEDNDNHGDNDEHYGKT